VPVHHGRRVCVRVHVESSSIVVRVVVMVRVVIIVDA
jgi:hypothetical protein